MMEKKGIVKFVKHAFVLYQPTAFFQILERISFKIAWRGKTFKHLNIKTSYQLNIIYWSHISSALKLFYLVWLLPKE